MKPTVAVRVGNERQLALIGLANVAGVDIDLNMVTSVAVVP
jgi:hypothetical protein